MKVNEKKTNLIFSRDRKQLSKKHLNIWRLNMDDPISTDRSRIAHESYGPWQTHLHLQTPGRSVRFQFDRPEQPTVGRHRVPLQPPGRYAGLCGAALPGSREDNR